MGQVSQKKTTSLTQVYYVHSLNAFIQMIGHAFAFTYCLFRTKLE